MPASMTNEDIMSRFRRWRGGRGERYVPPTREELRGPLRGTLGPTRGTPPIIFQPPTARRTTSLPTGRLHGTKSVTTATAGGFQAPTTTPATTPATTAPTNLTTPGGAFDFDAFRAAVERTATGIGTVRGGGQVFPPYSPAITGAEPAPAEPYYRGGGAFPGFGAHGPIVQQGRQVPAGAAQTQEELRKARYEAAVGAYKTQEQDLQAQAQKAEEAFRMQAAGVEARMKALAGSEERVGAIDKRIGDITERISGLGVEVGGAIGNARAAWGSVLAKADEYVTAARNRSAEALGKLEEIYSAIGKSRDYAKAHAMQVAAQATLGSMNREGRNIAERYGKTSKEYQQWNAGRVQALGAARSGVEATYGQLREAQDTTYLQVANASMMEHDMYTNFAEQQHIKTMEMGAQANAAYDMQATNLMLSMEQMKFSAEQLRLSAEEGMIGIGQMKANEMENLANWMVSSPTFTMDAQPYLTLLNEILTS